MVEWGNWPLSRVCCFPVIDHLICAQSPMPRHFFMRFIGYISCLEWPPNDHYSAAGVSFLELLLDWYPCTGRRPPVPTRNPQGKIIGWRPGLLDSPQPLVEEVLRFEVSLASLVRTFGVKWDYLFSKRQAVHPLACLGCPRLRGVRRPAVLQRPLQVLRSLARIGSTSHLSKFNCCSLMI